MLVSLVLLLLLSLLFVFAFVFVFVFVFVVLVLVLALVLVLVLVLVLLCDSSGSHEDVATGSLLRTDGCPQKKATTNSNSNGSTNYSRRA